MQGTRKDRPLSTKQWATSHGIGTDRILPPVADCNEPCRYSAIEIATRALILQGVVAVACGVDSEPVIQWYRDERIWDLVTPNERTFLSDPHSLSEEKINQFRWQQEAEWTLFWAIGKVDALGLPTHECNVRQLVDEIVPPLGSELQPFLDSVTLRPAGAILAEENRHYDLWCRYIQDRRDNPKTIPNDLLIPVLYQREYAFQWLLGVEDWDDVQCDA